MKTDKRTLTVEQKKETAALKKIWEARKRLAESRGEKFTQEMAMSAFGYNTQAAVSQYLNGKMALNIETIFKFSQYLKCDPTEIRPSIRDYFMVNPSRIGPSISQQESFTVVPVIPWHSLSLLNSLGGNFEELETMTLCLKYNAKSFFIHADDDAHAPYFKKGTFALIEPSNDTIGHRVLVEINGEFHIMEHCMLEQECFLPKRENAQQINITPDLNYKIHGIVRKLIIEQDG